MSMFTGTTTVPPSGAFSVFGTLSAGSGPVTVNPARAAEASESALRRARQVRIEQRHVGGIGVAVVVEVADDRRVGQGVGREPAQGAGGGVGARFTGEMSAPSPPLKVPSPLVSPK